MNAATEDDLEGDRVGGSWTPDRRKGRRFVGGGHLDPEECDRFEEVIREAVGGMSPGERDQWSRGAGGRRRK